MIKRTLWCALFLSLAFPAAAQTEKGPNLLDQAEEALVNIDFEKAGDLAEKALKTGKLASPDQSSRARYLVGVGAASRDDMALAKESFRAAISINPDLPVDSSLGPKLNSPFLEARGELSVRKEYLSAEVAIEQSPTGPVATVSVSDPVRVAKQVGIGLRPTLYESSEARPFQWESAKIERLEASIPLEQLGIRDQSELEDDIDGFDLAVVVKDEYGNVIFRVGSEGRPEHDANPYFSEPTAFEELVSSPWFWLGTVVVVGAAGTAVYAFAIAPPQRVGVISTKN